MTAYGSPEQKADDLRFMLNTSGWLNWPYLPIKIPGQHKVGVLWSGTLDGPPTFKVAREGNLFALDKLKEGDWEDVDPAVLVEEGWVVD